MRGLMLLMVLLMASGLTAGGAAEGMPLIEWVTPAPTSSVAAPSLTLEGQISYRKNMNYATGDVVKVWWNEAEGVDHYAAELIGSDGEAKPLEIEGSGVEIDIGGRPAGQYRVRVCAAPSAGGEAGGQWSEVSFAIE